MASDTDAAIEDTSVIYYEHHDLYPGLMLRVNACVLIMPILTPDFVALSAQRLITAYSTWKCVPDKIWDQVIPAFVRDDQATLLEQHRLPWQRRVHHLLAQQFSDSDRHLVTSPQADAPDNDKMAMDSQL